MNESDLSRYAPQVEKMPEEERTAWQQERLQVLGMKLQRLARDQVSRRREIQDRWLEDLRQYNGMYDMETEARLKANKESRVFANITRSKSNQAEARLYDMLFPTDDRNWAVMPTPVPELSEMADDPRQAMDPATGGPAVNPETGEPVSVGDQAQQLMDDAKDRAQKMEKEIEDHLTEAQYAIKARDAIHDACVYGTGVLKGPIVKGRSRRAWQQIDDNGVPVHVLDMVEERRPGVEHVSVWDFFPDMNATRVEDAEFMFERSYATKRDVRQLVKSPHYIVDQIKKLLQAQPDETHIASDHLAQLRELAGLQGNVDENRYELWKYMGPIEAEDLIACGCELPEDEKDNPLQEFQAVVEFAGNYVIKAYLHPIDTGDMLYSVFSYEKDDTSIFGFGVPRLMRNAQRIINASWRMILDNGGLAVGPQIVMNRSLVRPADGDWNIRGRKVWFLEDKMRAVGEVFGMYEISSHQAELANIFTMARQLADEEPSLPVIAQGEQGTHTTQTAQGMTILMNSANVVLRRAVKNFDDDVTVPLITRFYDWLMQYSEKEEIKGDYEVDARGSSVLMVREMQAQNLMTLAMNFAAHPVFGPMTKGAELYRKVVQAHHISEDDVVMTDDDIQAMQQQMAEAAAQQQQGAAASAAQDPSVLQAQHQAKLEQLAFERETKLMMADIDREIQLYKLAEQGKLTMAQLEAKLTEKAMTIRADREAQEREVQVKTAWGTGL